MQPFALRGCLHERRCAGVPLNGKDAGWAGAKSVGITPLINAESVELVRLLIANGADLSARNQNGKTALDWAWESGNKAKVAAIETAMAVKKP